MQEIKKLDTSSSRPFNFDVEGYVKAKEFLISINKFKDVSEESGYEVVEYANWLYSKREAKE